MFKGKLVQPMRFYKWKAFNASLVQYQKVPNLTFMFMIPFFYHHHSHDLHLYHEFRSRSHHQDYNNG